MKIEGLEKGEYIVRATVESNCDTEVDVYTNHRRFAARKLKLRRGEEKEISFAVALREADFQKQPSYDDNFIEIFALKNVKISAQAERYTLPVVYVLGDSTVCDQTEFGNDEFSTYCGWGQTLPCFLGEKMAVSNHAEQGTTTADCLACHFKAVERQIKKGDTVIMQFGHNDQKRSELTPEKYGENLVEICRLAEQKGAFPIICSPINRLIYQNGILNSYLLQYAKAAAAAADKCGAGFIDLHTMSSRQYIKMGMDAENLFCRKDELDRTHPSDYGAVRIGEYVALVLKAMKR